MSPRRRRILAMVAGGSVIGLAGCSEGSNDSETAAGESQTSAAGSDTDAGAVTTSTDSGSVATPDGTDVTGTATGDGGGASNESTAGNESRPTPAQNPEMVDDATLQMYMEWTTSNSNLTWSPFDYERGWPRQVYPLVMDRMVSVDQTTGEAIPMAVDEWSIAEDGTSWSFTFADGNWSDGTPILGKDFGMEMLLSRWTGRTPEEIKNSDTGPQGTTEAITDITWDGKTVTMHSEPGWFADFYMQKEITNPSGSGTLNAPDTSVLNAQAEQFWQELYDEVESDPWTQMTPERLEEFTAQRRENWDPTADQFPVSGPFDVSEVREDGVVLEKNPEFRLANAINWTRVEFTPMPEPRARYQALQSNNLDALPGILGAPNEQIVQAFPDNIQRHPHTFGTIAGLVLNGQQVDAFEDNRVRRAIAYALDKERIANVQNQYTTQAPPAPPGLMFPAAQQWVPDDLWETYNTYEQDLEKAASLMEAAGLTRENGQWMSDGQPLELPYLTGTQNLQAQQVVKQQLDEFGIPVQLNTQSNTILEERTGQGDFVMTDETWGTGDPVGIYRRAMHQSDRRHRFNVWSDEEIRNWVDQHDNITNEEYDWTNNVEGYTVEQTKRWTVPAPPVGEPDSDQRVEYPVVYYDLIWNRNLSDERRRTVMQELTWAFNWNLPLVIYSQSNQLAFQDHQQWNVPEDGDIWRQSDAQLRLIRQGHIQANPDAW